MEKTMMDREPHLDNFSRQFEQSKRYEFFGGEIESVDIAPEQSKDQVPVIVAPGWSESFRVFEDSLRVLVGEGRRASSIAHARGGEMPDAKSEHAIMELRKATALLKIVEEAGAEKVDAIAHSEGAINLMIAASISPEKFRSIVLVNPAGLIGPDKFLPLISRFTKNIVTSALEGAMEPSSIVRRSKGGAAAVSYATTNFSNAFKEANEISKSDIHNLLQDLHGKGVRIAVIHGVDDPVFPMKRMNKERSELTAQEIDGFVSVKGGHNEIYVHPEQYMKSAAGLLEKLTKKSERDADT